jgi:hypothetical protein
MLRLFCTSERRPSNAKITERYQFETGGDEENLIACDGVMVRWLNSVPVYEKLELGMGLGD